MYLINKLFNDKTIRTVWDKDKEKYYVSVVDVAGAISESKDKQSYWRKLKQRLKEEGNETVTNCHALKLKAQDGKYRMTDVVDIAGMFRIIESIPSKNAEPIKQWLAHLGSERIDEIFDPSIATQRSIDLYRTKGFDEKWISERIKGIQNRKELTDVWKDGGITETKEYAILTNEIYKEWSGMKANEYKEFKGLRKESLRDNMTRIEELLTDLGEEATKELAKKHRPKGLEANKKIAKLGGHAAKSARDDLEKNLGASVITSENNLNYKYIEDNKKIDNK
ncbi:MAG: phage antirepressor protein [Bacilli bacterium]|nr:phage antirepressor protein [Bacilli bacterium]